MYPVHSPALVPTVAPRTAKLVHTCATLVHLTDFCPLECCMYFPQGTPLSIPVSLPPASAPPTNTVDLVGITLALLCTA